MTRLRCEIPDQKKLWNNQHTTRLEFLDELKFIPNPSAVEFADYLKPSSTVLEIGAANGRDARYWASLGHSVYAVDFSEVALDQLKYLAIEQGVEDMVAPILWDIGNGRLPVAGIPQSVDAFYARSALHVDDCEMYILAFELSKLLVPGGKIFIEGKGPNDKKIARSRSVGRNLVIDDLEGGHLRRVWTCQFGRELCTTMGWDILNIKDRQEVWNDTPATFMTLIAQKGY